MDSLEYTVMSYSADVGGPSWSATTGPAAGNYPQTYMMLDLASLQSQYGADFSTNSGDTVYKWDSVTGAMSVNNTVTHDAPGSKIFMTMWDGGGNDTYDASNYSNGVTIDLRPGGWTTLSTSQLADLDAKTAGIQGAAGNIANSLYISGTGADGNLTDNLIENAIGGSGIDHITGNDAANHLTGGGGADQLAGGKGADAFIYTNENDSTGVQADRILDLDHFDFIDMGKVDANRNRTGNQDFTWHDGLTGYNDLAIGEIGFVENADHSGGLLLAKVAVDAVVDFEVHISFAEPLAFGSAFIHQDAPLA